MTENFFMSIEQSASLIPNFVRKVDQAFLDNKQIYMCIYSLADKKSEDSNSENEKMEHVEGVCINYYKKKMIKIKKQFIFK